MFHGHSDVAKLSRDTLSVSVTAESVLERSKKSGKKKTDGGHTTWSQPESFAELVKQTVRHTPQKSGLEALPNAMTVPLTLQKSDREAPPNAMKGYPTRE